MSEHRQPERPDTDRASWRQTMALALGSVVIVGLLTLMPQWHWLESRSFDVLSTLAPPQPAEPSSVVVAIDEPSFAEFGLQWPWPRDFHARLIEQLRAAGARGIVLDLVFAEPGADAQADAALARTVGPDVVLAADETPLNDPKVAGSRRIEPLSIFLESGAQSGLVKLPLDDGIVRRIPERQNALAKVVLLALLRQPADAPGDALIQYFGPRRVYPTVSYYQAIDWPTYLPSNPFKDKVVFVGFGQDAQADVAAGSADAFPTSFTSLGRGWTYGAEIHATILDNLRFGLWIKPVPAWITALLALAIALATGHVLRRFGLVRSATWTVAGLAAVLAFSFALLQYGRYWLPPVLPVTALVLMSVGRTGLGYLQERARRRWIVTVFGHYLAPEMVERLQTNPDLLKLGGEVKELTILFCDVRGFTAISERMQADPERLTHLVNRILTPLSNCVLAEKGAIDKYIGDCIMAFWNAPLDEPDHALKAAHAALGMMAAIKALNRELGAENLPSIAIGIGLNTGRCVVGNMGSEQRFDYSALGDSVNLASRLEAASKELGVSIVIGPETARQIGDRLPLVPLETIRVKGKQEDIAVHTIAPELAGHSEILREVRAVHTQLATRDEPLWDDEGQALIKRVTDLAPSLARYYALLEQRRRERYASL